MEVWKACRYGGLEGVQVWGLWRSGGSRGLDLWRSCRHRAAERSRGLEARRRCSAAIKADVVKVDGCCTVRAPYVRAPVYIIYP
jgi:hypothetical protein